LRIAKERLSRYNPISNKSENLQDCRSSWKIPGSRMNATLNLSFNDSPDWPASRPRGTNKSSSSLLSILHRESSLTFTIRADYDNDLSESERRKVYFRNNAKKRFLPPQFCAGRLSIRRFFLFTTHSTLGLSYALACSCRNPFLNPSRDY